MAYPYSDWDPDLKSLDKFYQIKPIDAMRARASVYDVRGDDFDRLYAESVAYRDANRGSIAFNSDYSFKNLSNPVDVSEYSSVGITGAAGESGVENERGGEYFQTPRWARVGSALTYGDRMATLGEEAGTHASQGIMYQYGQESPWYNSKVPEADYYGQGEVEARITPMLLLTSSGGDIQKAMIELGFEGGGFQTIKDETIPIGVRHFRTFYKELKKTDPVKAAILRNTMIKLAPGLKVEGIKKEDFA